MFSRLRFVTLAATLAGAASVIAVEASAPSPAAVAVPPAPPSVDALLARCTKILTYGDSFSASQANKVDAVAALGLLGDPRAVPLLADHLRNSENPLLRRQIVRALAWIGGDAAVAVLEETTRDRDPELRPGAATALRALTGRDYPYDPTGVNSRQRIIDELRARAEARR